MSGEGRFDGRHLWMAVGVPSFGLIMASKDAQQQGVAAHAWPIGGPAVAANDSLTYLGLRPVDGDPTAREFDVYGHGPDADRLVAQALERITPGTATTSPRTSRPTTPGRRTRFPWDS